MTTSLVYRAVLLPLVLLLVGTTPLGTGVGAHQFDLLHPLLSHMHIVNGRVLSHEQLDTGRAKAADQGVPGPAIGAGSGGDAEYGGPGLSPTLPWQPLDLQPPQVRSISVDQRQPSGRVEAPPDPPPTRAA